MHIISASYPCSKCSFILINPPDITHLDGTPGRQHGNPVRCPETKASDSGTAGATVRLRNAETARSKVSFRPAIICQVYLLLLVDSQTFISLYLFKIFMHSSFAIVINRLSYASPAWWGFVSADDRHRLDAFLSRSTKLGYRSNSSATFTSICDDADNQLFDRITGNSQHLLHSLLPPERDQHYSLRERSHNYQLPGRTTAVNDKNFILRMLYKDI